MLRFLKSNSPSVIFIIVVISILLWLGLFINGPIYENLYNRVSMPFMEQISSNLGQIPFIGILIAYLLTLLIAFQLIRINKAYMLISSRTYLPALFYLIIASSFIEIAQFNGLLLGTLLLVLTFELLFKIYRREGNLEILYMAGLLISIASLFYFPFIYFFAVIWISLVILRPFIGREWFVPILGLITPYLFIITYFFVFQPANLDNLNSTLFHFVRMDFSFPEISLAAGIFLAILGLFIFVSSVRLIGDFPKKKIRVRKYFQVFWWIFSCTLLIVVLFKNVFVELIIIGAIPVSYLLSEYLYICKNRWFSAIIFTLFLLSVAYFKIDLWIL